LVYAFDLTRSAELERSFTAFMTGNEAEVSHFVHSAGHMKMLPLKMVSLEAINTTFAINVISAALLIKVLVQRKINADALSSVVLISSNISNFGAKALSVYGASKGAMDSMMKCLAVELAPKVRLNSVLPGALDTEMTRNIFGDQELLDRMMKEYPLGPGEPNDIFEMVNFLLSERSKWITGQQFAVDGGRTINISG
jgi:NAD(P)-dependent dehydrogenase (short-subunit alcohol dehydrogenase family)